ncbi:MAG: T9SS type A sorting domain-containing protein [Lewinellaceae bacterium]|nr:T9SS type A sorting domain-containing protein [Phaeodactylibacter sp.]MCB9039398.1 T9SS type A sorting domain-containing protein [Lewinellaceae bacterium]
MKRIDTICIGLLLFLITINHALAQDTGCDPDTESPSLVCIAGLSVLVFPDTPGTQIWASDILVGPVFDNCTGPEDIQVRIGLDNGSPTPPSTTSVFITQFGTQPVTVWAIDEAGNAGACFTFVQGVPAGQNDDKRIIGNIFNDENGNCIQDVGEEPLEGWRVELNGQPNANGPAFSMPFALSGADGSYALAVPNNYLSANDSLELNLPLVLNLNQSCPLSYRLDSSDFAGADTLYYDFPVQLSPGCASLSVDIAAPFLRLCFESVYNLSFCNYGAEAAEDAYVEVTFDNYLTPLSSTLPWSSADGQTYTFQLEDVLPGECGTFKVFVDVSCDAILGQTHCTEAHIFPDQPCILPYSGPEIAVDARCEDGESQVVFTIANVGDEPMTEALEYLVVEDVIMYMQAPFQLGSGEFLEIPVSANGATFRLEAEQVAGFPYPSLPSATVEGCGQNAMGEVSLGFVSQFPQNEAVGFIAIDCQENIGAYDPNDKQASPRGVGEQHFLRKNTGIDYKIRFQNTGTDTAFNIVVLDTLSSFLDIGSVRPGASSHAYDFKILNGRVLEFRFNHIMLPDSNVNQAGSNGFVQFSVRQQPDNPDGTVIENAAAIYFDFNEPVITNTVFHTIGEMVMVGLDEPGQVSYNRLYLYPNPAAGKVVVQLDKPLAEAADMLIYHSTGQLALWQPLRGPAQEFSIGHLPEGLYFLRVVRGQQVLGTGKLIVGR